MHFFLPVHSWPYGTCICLLHRIWAIFDVSDWHFPASILNGLTLKIKYGTLSRPQTIKKGVLIEWSTDMSALSQWSKLLRTSVSAQIISHCIVPCNRLVWEGSQRLRRNFIWFTVQLAKSVFNIMYANNHGPAPHLPLEAITYQQLLPFFSYNPRTFLWNLPPVEHNGKGLQEPRKTKVKRLNAGCILECNMEKLLNRIDLEDEERAFNQQKGCWPTRQCPPVWLQSKEGQSEVTPEQTKCITRALDAEY